MSKALIVKDSNFSKLVEGLNDKKITYLSLLAYGFTSPQSMKVVGYTKTALYEWRDADSVFALAEQTVKANISLYEKELHPFIDRIIEKGIVKLVVQMGQYEDLSMEKKADIRWAYDQWNKRKVKQPTGSYDEMILKRHLEC